MTKLAISVSFCADHRKGDGQIMDHEEHWSMFLDTVAYLRSEWPDACMIGSVSACRDEDLHRLEAIPKPFTFYAARLNYGYLEGATYAIDRAVALAKINDCELLIHTCEDVVPRRGVIANMVRLMEGEGLDYIGERWRDETVKELSTQFFGCRVSYMAERFNGNGKNGILAEAYMGLVMDGRRIATIGRQYDHTHTFSQYQRLLAEARR